MDKKVLATLTKEQEAIVEKTKEEWIKFILNGGDDIDVAAATKWGKWLYTNKGFKEPEIHFGDSPKDCQVIANKLDGNTDDKVQWYNFTHESLGQSGGWVTYVDMFVQLGIFQNEEFDNYTKFLKSGAFLTLTFEDHLIICRRPLFTKVNSKFELHSTDSPAIAWRDGFELFFLNGIQVTKELVMTPASQLDPMLLIKERNAEVRREIVRKMGIERFIQKVGGQDLDTWSRDEHTDYRLIKLTNIEGMRLVPVYLIMKNPSTGLFYAEGVSPDCKTVKEALAWRDEETQYHEPDVLT